MIFPWKIPVWIVPESAHGNPELVKHASLVEVDGMSRNRSDRKDVAKIVI